MKTTTAVLFVLLFLRGAGAGASPASSADADGGLELGDLAPDVKLVDQRGYEVHLSELWSQGPLVLYFYPKDFTPGCTLESLGFRDAIQEFAEAGVQVAGVSIDSHESHKRFAERHDLPFTLLSDPHASAADAYGVQKTFYGFIVSRRVTYLIDRDGRVAWTWDPVEPDGHAEEVLAEARRLGLGDTSVAAVRSTPGR